MELSPKELNGLVQLLARAVVMNRIEICAVRSAYASVGTVPYNALLNARQYRLDLARPLECDQRGFLRRYSSRTGGTVRRLVTGNEQYSSSKTPENVFRRQSAVEGRVRKSR
jgi:hypothetical protein